MIDGSWLDRPLGVAGRVLVQEGDAVRSRLVHVDRDLLVIPSLAIHMNREVNKGYEFNRQRDLCPLFSVGALGAGAFDAMLAEELGVEPGQILGPKLELRGGPVHTDAKIPEAEGRKEALCLLGGFQRFRRDGPPGRNAGRQAGIGGLIPGK